MDSTSKPAPRRRFFVVRVAILLFVLFLVVLVALRDIRSRHARTEWDRTLDVAIVLVHIEGESALDAEAVQRLTERASVLEERIGAEAERHRAGLPKPFRFRVFGPVDVATGAPTPASDRPTDLAKQVVEQRRWLHDVDPRAGVEPDHWDSRIYVRARRPASGLRTFVEGTSEQGGRIGVVDVELDASMVDLTLFVVTHELLHTLGASDKYDESGRTRIPEGLAEPDRTPRFPQRFAEVMARNRPLSASTETIPESIDELAVGEATAREIGWVR